MFFFLCKTWSPHYPQCLATDWHHRRQFIRFHAPSSGATKGLQLFSHIRWTPVNILYCIKLVEFPFERITTIPAVQIKWISFYIYRSCRHPICFTWQRIMRDTAFLSTWTSCRSLSTDLAFSKASIQEFEVVLTLYFTPATSNHLTVFCNCSVTATSSPFKSDLGFISLLGADVLTECKASASRLPGCRQSLDGWNEVYVAARMGERRQKPWA